MTERLPGRMEGSAGSNGLGAANDSDGARGSVAGTTISWREALGVWCRVALLSFGGPTGQIAVMHRVFVDEKRWVDEPRFLEALNFCLLLPGPVAQQAVERYGWLAPGEMLDGLGMAETTPGPLIMVVQFVAFMGAYRSPGPLSPLGAGLLASVLAVWVTFIPCFYWIFLGAPHIERLRGDRRLAGTLSAISSAVVGVILNLSLWFAAHTLFATVKTGRWGLFRYLDIDWGTWQPEAVWILVLAAAWMLIWKRGMAVTLAVCAGAGVALRLVGA